MRTGYSFRTAVGHLSDVISRLQEIGSDVAPIADRFNTFGFMRWTKLAEKAGLRPVYGVELGVTATMGAKPPTVDYWTFYAKDSLRPLHDLITKATANNEKLPMVTYQQAMDTPGLIKIAGERILLDAMAEVKPAPWQDGFEDFYFGVTPVSPRQVLREAKNSGFQFVAHDNNYYPRADDLDFYRVGIGKHQASTQSYSQHILSDDEYLKLCSMFDKELLSVALANRTKMFDKCQAKIRKATMLTPEKPETLRGMCILGAQRTGTDLTDPVYYERLDRELNLIADKKFEDYFYIIADMVAFAKKHMIVGPARGSSCGSLVCYLLDITTVDPIPYGLYFERFIDVNRADLPDIDIDFSDTNRHLVFAYATQKYGADHVARLGTVGMFKARSVMRQVGAQLDIPRWELDKVLDTMGERTLSDALENTKEGQTLLSKWPEAVVAGRLENHPNNASQHAAGIVITQEPTVEYVAVAHKSNSVMCDKKDAEDYDLLKIDALGLTQLSVFERTLELMGEVPKSGWLEQLPLNDPFAFDVLNNGHFSGIFQFNGPALQGLVKQINVTCLDDIVSITALARPGPMQSGASNSWARRKAGLEEVEYVHPAFEPYLKPTLGVVIYQEQVLQIGREIGDLSWPEVTDLRKAISKSMGKEELDKHGVKWKAGAANKGIPEDVRNSFWDDLCLHGKYSFNKAHSVAYAIVSYYCCWLKAHYPAEFAAATLDPEPLAVRQILMLRELHFEGTDYVPIDKDHSTDKWNIMDRDGKRVLVGPLSLIKGIGPSSVKQILTARAEGEELKPGLRKKLEEAKTEIDTLFPIEDYLKRMYTTYPDLSAPPARISSPITKIKDCQCGVPGSVVVIATFSKITIKDENDPAVIDKRGYTLYGNTQALNLWAIDDTDEIFCKINRDLYDTWAKDIIDRGRLGKALYAIKGTIPRGFRMISVDMVRYIGDLDEEVAK